MTKKEKESFEEEEFEETFIFNDNGDLVFDDEPLPKLTLDIVIKMSTEERKRMFLFLEKLVNDGTVLNEASLEAWQYLNPHH